MVRSIWGNPAPTDKNGHGTQVTALILGGTDGTGPMGVAPEAKWMAAKIFNNRGEATLSAIHQGYQWALDPDGDPSTADIPHIAHNSWGLANNPGKYLPEFHDDIAALAATGITCVSQRATAAPRAAQA